MCVYACTNCMQNARFQLMRTIDAKLCFHSMFQNSFQNIERQKHYRNFWGNRSELWPSIYKFKKVVGRADFSDQFRKIILRVLDITNIMRQSACLVLTQSQLITLLPSFFIARRWVGLNNGPDIKLFFFSWLGPELFCLLLGPPGFNCWFSFTPVFQWCCSTS